MTVMKIHDIISSSPIGEWELDLETGNFSHKVLEDLNIVKVTNLYKNQKNGFWEAHCETDTSKVIEYVIIHRKKYVAQYSFVELKGSSIVLPLPRLGTKEISSDQLYLSKIINTQTSIEDLIRQARLKIQNSFIK